MQRDASGPHLNQLLVLSPVATDCGNVKLGAVQRRSRPRGLAVLMRITFVLALLGACGALSGCVRPPPPVVVHHRPAYRPEEPPPPPPPVATSTQPARPARPLPVPPEPVSAAAAACANSGSAPLSETRTQQLF